jgi:hypothetical protein
MGEVPYYSSEEELTVKNTKEYLLNRYVLPHLLEQIDEDGI